METLMQRSTKHPASGGFTLIELMVVVVIITILVSIAVPMYSAQVRQSRRTDARTAVLDLAGREERFLATNPSGYTNSAASLGYSAFGSGTPIGQNYYYLNAPCIAAVGGTLACTPSYPAAPGPTGPSFYVTAQPVATGSQAKDTQCAVFGVDSTGRQFAQNSGGTDNTAYCWAN
jgi:type IV pilus assembly protein PilE